MKTPTTEFSYHIERVSALLRHLLAILQGFHSQKKALFWGNSCIDLGVLSRWKVLFLFIVTCLAALHRFCDKNILMIEFNIRTISIGAPVPAAEMKPQSPTQIQCVTLAMSCAVFAPYITICRRINISFHWNSKGKSQEKVIIHHSLSIVSFCLCLMLITSQPSRLNARPRLSRWYYYLTLTLQQSHRFTANDFHARLIFPQRFHSAYSSFQAPNKGWTGEGKFLLPPFCHHRSLQRHKREDLFVPCLDSAVQSDHLLPA